MICEGSSTKSQATLVPARLADFHAAQQVVQQVAELVENGLHFAVRQQRRLAADGRREVAADQSQVRAEFAAGAGPPVISASIQAPPRLFSRGYQSA